MSERQFTTGQIANQLGTVFDSTLTMDWLLADSCLEVAPVLALNRPDDVQVLGVDLTNGQRFKVIVEEVKP